jgi:hypothetical protein
MCASYCGYCPDVSTANGFMSGVGKTFGHQARNGTTPDPPFLTGHYSTVHKTTRRRKCLQAGARPGFGAVLFPFLVQLLRQRQSTLSRTSAVKGHCPEFDLGLVGHCEQNWAGAWWSSVHVSSPGKTLTPNLLSELRSY